ncbi:hypothetical protein RDI58_003933 [Solanum bulbocastanum]|uniref:Uncharacterized protein n=1 Tax=Solanum bulbocastanum TaxID=147425 RepID=A0AAN8U5I9_SOLBU
MDEDCNRYHTYCKH